MAARRHLPGLPAQLRGLGRRRRRRPARHHRAPRLSRPRRPRRRCAVAVADLSVARARPGLRRQRPRARRPAVRDRGGFRPPRRGRPSARHPGRARPGHEPHERPAPLVRGLARAARRPARGLVPVARPIGLRPRPASRSRRTTGSRTSVARAGNGTLDRGQFYYHTFLVEQPELDWRAPGVEDAQFGMIRGWLARGVDGFRLDVFNRFLKHPGLPSNPTQPGSTAWARQIHVNDGDQPDFPELIGRFRDIVDERPGRMSIGELFDGTVERAAGLTTDRHLVFDWELVESAWTGAGIRGAIARREAAFGDRPVADGRPLEPRSVARRLASRRPDPGRRSRCRGAGRGGAAADDARDAVPVLRRGARAARRQHPGGGVGRPAGRPCRTGLRLVGPLGLPGADALDGGSRRRVHDGPAVASVRTRRRHAQRRRPGGRPVVSAVAVSPAHRVAGDEPGAPGRDAPARSGRDRTISSPTPGRPTGRSSSWSSTSVGAGPRGGSRTRHRTGRGDRSSGRRPIRRRARRSPVVTALDLAPDEARVFERIG